MRAPGEGLEHALVESRGSLPERPPAGDYVVVDVTHFSTTVVELLAAGATCVFVPGEAGEGLDFREERPDALVGCEPARFADDGRYDFRNSPSHAGSCPWRGGRRVSSRRTAPRRSTDCEGTTTSRCSSRATQTRGRSPPTCRPATGR
jgi:2-phosphosulfolactate phosphatase